MRKTVKLALALFASIALLPSCKDYADNEGLFDGKPEKNIVGTWQLKSSEYEETFASEISSVENIFSKTQTFDGSLMTEVEGDKTKEYPYSEKFTFNEDGTYIKEKVTDGETRITKSTWYFLDGAEENQILVMEAKSFVIKQLDKKTLNIFYENSSNDTFTNGDIFSSTRTETKTYTKL